MHAYRICAYEVISLKYAMKNVVTITNKEVVI